MADKLSHGCRRRLIIMAKEPRMGVVKTRLAREVGAVAAVHYYRTVTANLIRRLAYDPRWSTVLAVSPDRAVHSRLWPTAIARTPQGAGDIGARMERLLRAHRLGPAILIGSDIPGVRRADIADAFALLDRRDLVFGPAEDGGFWLVGVKPAARIENLFGSVRWSSPYALTDTLANLSGRSIGFAARLSDIDNARSLAVAGVLGRGVTLSAGPRDQSFS